MTKIGKNAKDGEGCFAIFGNEARCWAWHYSDKKYIPTKDLVRIVSSRNAAKIILAYYNRFPDQIPYA